MRDRKRGEFIHACAHVEKEGRELVFDMYALDNIFIAQDGRLAASGRPVLFAAGECGLRTAAQGCFIKEMSGGGGSVWHVPRPGLQS